MEPSSQLFSLVMLGDFNPKIFQPAWFGREGIIRLGESDEANLEIIHPDIVVFTLDWLRLQVTREQFVVQTELDPYDRVIRDLVVSTFKKLIHTPIHSMGINRHMHFRVSDEDTWNNIGHTLAPKEKWLKIMNDPGLNKLVMVDKKRNNGYKGFLKVTVEPSEKIRPGIYFTVNDHYEVEDKKSSFGANEILDVLDKNWDASINNAKEKIEKLMESLI